MEELELLPEELELLPLSLELDELPLDGIPPVTLLADEPKDAAIETIPVMFVTFCAVLLAKLLLKLFVTCPPFPAQGFEPAGA